MTDTAPEGKRLSDTCTPRMTPASRRRQRGSFVLLLSTWGLSKSQRHKNKTKNPTITVQAFTGQEAPSVKFTSKEPKIRKYIVSLRHKWYSLAFPKRYAKMFERRKNHLVGLLAPFLFVLAYSITGPQLPYCTPSRATAPHTNQRPHGDYGMASPF